MSRKTDQLSSVIRDAVQGVIQRGFHDPRISGIITVTGVRVTEDLVEAIVSVSVLPHEREDLTLHGLKGAASHIRREIGPQVGGRRLPKLVFKLDPSLRKQSEVLAALAKVAEERDRTGRASPESAESAMNVPPPGPDAPEGSGATR